MVGHFAVPTGRKFFSALKKSRAKDQDLNSFPL